MHPPANARSNSTRALVGAFPGRVRVIGYSNLSQLQRGLTFDHMFCIGLREPSSTLTCLAVSLKEATDEISHAMYGNSVQTSGSAESAALQVSAFDGVPACQLHVLVAPENLEATRAVRLQAIVGATPVVVGTSGRITGRVARDSRKLGDSFSQVCFEKVSMYEGGDCLVQSLNNVTEGLLVPGLGVVLVGDPTRGPPHRQGNVCRRGLGLLTAVLQRVRWICQFKLSVSWLHSNWRIEFILPTPLKLVCDWIN